MDCSNCHAKMAEEYSQSGHGQANFEKKYDAPYCTTCHGKVMEMDVVYPAVSMKMGWCLDCHRKNLNDPKFPTTMDCVTCHH